MAGNVFPKQTEIYCSGQPMTTLHLITSGSVKVKYPGGEYMLGKGDVIGICEICSEVHFLTYEAAVDTAVLTYPFTSMQMLGDMMSKNVDIGKFFLQSALRQINTVFSHCEVSSHACNNIYDNLVVAYNTYENICDKHRLAPTPMRGMEDLTAFISEEEADFWLASYYLGFLQVFSGPDAERLLKEYGIAIGFLRKASLDFRKTYQSIEEQFQYQEEVLSYYFNDRSDDLFSRITLLYGKVSASGGDEELSALLASVIQTAKKSPALNTALFTSRVENFKKNMPSKKLDESGEETQEVDNTSYQSLADSLSTILDYAEVDDDTYATWRRLISSYKALPDKSSLEDDVCKLRREIIKEFYALYSTISGKSLTDSNVPVPVKLFLYFGYMDEDLAGSENCAYLTSILPGLGNENANGVYPFYDWLKAIYKGKKEPSRNEFDEDYTDYMHKQKASGNITEAEMRTLLGNTMSKVGYELRNMFQQVNKITYGRITTFCPTFTSDNIMKKLPSSYLTAANLGQALNQVRAIDFSLFYREVLAGTIDPGNTLKEPIHVECLPDIILMPNVGTRGVMWQEIEGKRRTTPARFMLSIFHMEDIDATIIRLAGEYRWEMCKRVQGARWNDISEKSLTSEYFDYIQFYRKNNELSSEMKERVHLSLQRAKNSFKEMFVRDYILWILFESTGSPRLNKVARRILFSYCPQSADIREKLKTNPLYGELLQRYEMKNTQKIHRLEQVRQKAPSSAKLINDEIDFYNR